MLRDIIPFKFSTWLDAYCFITHNVRVLPQDKSQLILDQLEMTNDQIERLEKEMTKAQIELQTSIVFNCLNILLLQVQSLPECENRVAPLVAPIRRLPMEMVGEIADQDELTMHDVTSLSVTCKFFSRSPVLMKAASKKKDRWKIYFGFKQKFVIDSLYNHLYADPDLDLDNANEYASEPINKIDGINLSRIPLPPGEVPLDVFTGRHHAFVLCKSNNVYGLGLSDDGGLGIGDINGSYQTEPQKFLYPPEGVVSQEVVRYLAAGENFTLAACSGGSIYVCGNHGSGSLGLGEIGWWNRYEIYDEPRLLKLPNNDKPLQMACGRHHSVILSESKRLYVFGGNHWGQLGLGNIVNTYLPHQLILPNGAIPKCVAAGEYHTLVLCENGAIYAFGDNEHRQLGLSLSNPNHQLPSVTTPQLVDIPKGITIKKMIASSTFSMLLCEDGRIFEFGDIKYSAQDQLRRVPTPQPAVLPKGEIPVDIIERFGQFIILFKSGNFIGNHHLRSLNFDENHQAKYTPITSINELETEIKKLSKSTPSVIHPASPKR